MKPIPKKAKVWLPGTTSGYPGAGTNFLGTGINKRFQKKLDRGQGVISGAEISAETVRVGTGSVSLTTTVQKSLASQRHRKLDITGRVVCVWGGEGKLERY